MFKKKEYIDIINKARRKRAGKDRWKYIAGIIAVILLAVVVIAAVKAIMGNTSNKTRNTSVNETQSTVMETESSVSEEELAAQKEAEEKQAVVDSYTNLGVVFVDGYLNVRESAGKTADVIGKLYDGSACEILDTTEDGWSHINSGGVDGYINSDYVVTGDEAKEAAYEQVKLRAIINADKLNIRVSPSTDADVVNQVYANERYEVLGQENGWVQINSGYISGDYVTVQYALNEARKLDLRSMVLNLYDNIGISDVDNYLNIREEPSESGKIIGKMPSKAAGDIIETLDGWYKIKSGSITGYVKSDYILTGAAAKDEALAEATLMAIVSTDMLNARKEPSTDSAIWTQISNNERYAVLSQTDGWVEIELEEDSSAFVATDYVDVRYALGEAIKFSPLETAAANSSSRRNQIVNYALQFLGNPYVWGGTSLTRGADCSGFTMSVMANFGISLPHYSGSQAKMGRGVTSAEMKPGDLVFYANSSGTINHVGIYIGNGQIVNAASKRSGIKISTWNYRTPVKIRNVID